MIWDDGKNLCAIRGAFRSEDEGYRPVTTMVIEALVGASMPEPNSPLIT
jgi:hypothetical protein